MPINKSPQNIILYEGKDGNFKLEVHLQNETVWLSQKQMATPFSTKGSKLLQSGCNKSLKLLKNKLYHTVN